MEQNTVELICRSCGKSIQIPTGLESFSCVYCGEKMTLQEAQPKMPEVVGTQDEADCAYAQEHLVDCIAQFDNYMKYFTKKQYDKYFYQYLRETRPIMEAVDRYVQTSTDKDAQLKAFVNRFLDDREAYHRSNKLWKLRKNTLLFESKLLIALYMVPAIREMRLQTSEDFVRVLHAEFSTRYPQDTFTPGTYDEISAGFRGRKLCFITTAVCAYEGKRDDCAELQAFRSFRDGWLSETAEGRALIEEYYQIAPTIVSLIYFCDDRAAVYGALRRDYLTPCYAAIGKQDYAACRRIYERMVRDLQARYGLS